MRCLDVRGQPAQAQAQHAGRQVRHPSGREDDETGVVADQVQAPELLILRPPDPAVARGQLERARLPADQREPGLAVQRDMAQALADDAVEPQVVMLLDQTVPEPVLTPAAGRADRDLAQVDGRTRCRKNHHGRQAATWKTKWPPPKSRRGGHWADNKIALSSLPILLTFL
ncbi:MAG: hypothetical protein OXD36_01595 [Rhodobacter sp.]|nr:hypothetical protein [Rhodobacter sp.]